MEAIGLVNEYVPYDPNLTKNSIYTINLANGTTPFLLFVKKTEYRSLMYRIRGPRVEVTEAWYRPTKVGLLGLVRSTVEHVLNGGLLHAPLASAVKLQLPDDPVHYDWDYEKFQAWCLDYYGQRLPPMEKPRALARTSPPKN